MDAVRHQDAAARRPATAAVVRAAARRLLHARAEPLGPERLGRSAWVVSPHPDDETLGCGGLIACKRRAGARVRVVFASDGEGSHAAHANRRDLAHRRQQEARAACARLGVPPSDVSFLHLPDGQLTAHVNRGARLLAPLFAQAAMDELVLPYRHEPPADHRAAASMARRAARRVRWKAEVLEYPVWFWTRWPWIPWDDERGRRPRALVRQAFDVTRDLVRAYRDLDVVLDVREVLDLKRAALAEHHTQMERQADVGWAVLADVDGGWLLRNLLEGRELFHREPAP